MDKAREEGQRCGIKFLIKRYNIMLFPIIAFFVLIIVFPIWLIYEIRNEFNKKRIILVIIMCLCFVYLSYYIANVGTMFNDNMYFGGIHKKLINTIITQMKSSDYDDLLKELESMNEKYVVRYEKREQYENAINHLINNVKTKNKRENTSTEVNRAQ